MKSILQKNKVCFLTGATERLHSHHIFAGSNRKVSEKYGFKVWLRADWHVGTSYCVHANKNLDLHLKQYCQRVFEKTHSRADFIKIIGRNYLEE